MVVMNVETGNPATVVANTHVVQTQYYGCYVTDHHCSVYMRCYIPDH